MKAGTQISRMAAAAGLASLVWTGSMSAAQAADAIDPEAKQVLQSMSDFLGKQRTFSVDYESDFDVMTRSGQKLKFVSSGSLAAERPGKLHATRNGIVTNVEIILDGSAVTIYGKKLNGFAQFPATTIQEAIDTIRGDVGFDAPGADLLVENPLNNEQTDLTSGEHIGMTVINGISVHHLAFRGDETDWQLWVKDGEDPLPLRYVISDKWSTGAPEFSLQLSNWNTSPSFDPDVFKFSPAAGASKLSSVGVDEAGQLVGSGE